ncbi:hypothetical protein AVEN_80819-1 [Araneus ventricosus]|uniref:Uncharacterized protein n=1 Tax=Araneus ventricosus TaxID=182803 RepID=A0A4Y2NWF4_ARAVE|nr:hypothetical protein AVEN_80819-1 [Araneus ventricosus]
MSNFPVLRTISLLEPPVPSNLNNVISPPRSVCVSSPRRDLMTCSVVVENILLSLSPISSRTRRQLRERRTAVISSDLSNHLIPRCLDSSDSNFNVCSISSDQATSYSKDLDIPLDLSPVRASGSSLDLCSISQCNLNSSSTCANENQLIEQKLAECFEQLAVSPLDLVVRPRIHDLTEPDLDILRSLSVSESEICLIANPVLEIVPPTDSKSDSSASNSDNKSNNVLEDDKSTAPSCHDRKSPLDSLDSKKDLECSSVSGAKFSCHLCPFTAVKRSGLRLHMKKNHDTWKVSNDFICLGENPSECSVLKKSVTDPKDVNTSVPSSSPEDLTSVNSCNSSPKDIVESSNSTLENSYQTAED